MSFRDRNKVSANFMIDGKNMPEPDEYQIDPNIVSSDATRRVDDGVAIVPFLTVACTITWKYKYIDQKSYDLLYDAYILETLRKSQTDPDNAMYHTLRTKDSNSGNIYNFTIYTQNDFKAPLKKIVNGVREYRDVIFTFTSIGGDQTILTRGKSSLVNDTDIKESEPIKEIKDLEVK